MPVKNEVIVQQVFFNAEPMKMVLIFSGKQRTYLFSEV